MTRTKFGFTLVEPLLVVASIGILVALFLPDVRCERGAARQTSFGSQCAEATGWIATLRDINDPADDQGHMVLYQTGQTPNGPQSDDRHVTPAHVGLSQFVMCDGAVLAIPETRNLRVYESLGMREGGEILDLDDS